MNRSADLLKREDRGLYRRIRLTEEWNKGLYWLQPSGLQSADKHSPDTSDGREDEDNSCLSDGVYKLCVRWAD